MGGRLVGDTGEGSTRFDGNGTVGRKGGAVHNTDDNPVDGTGASIAVVARNDSVDGIA